MSARHTAQNLGQRTGEDGVIKASDGLNYTKFRLISSIEHETMMSYMMKQSGLEENQIASNSWGFPAIPIPKVRVFSGVVRLAPTNVNVEFLGHPIYWTDPKLTKRIDGETDEEWSIRMYFMLLRMGYWKDGVGWINFLADRGFKFQPADVEGYHMLSNPKISIDLEDNGERFRFLNESDIHGGLEAVEQDLKNALRICSEAWKSELRQFVGQQREALESAYEIIGGESKMYSAQASPDDVDGAWVKFIEPELYLISSRYDEEMEKEAPQLSSILEDATEKFSEVQDMLASFENVAAILSVPVVRVGETASESYSHILSFIGIAASQASSRGAKAGSIVSLIHECFTDKREVGAIERVIVETYERYSIIWRRVRMSAINNERVAKKLDPFITYQELEVSLVGNALGGDEVYTPGVDSEEFAEEVVVVEEMGRRNRDLESSRSPLQDLEDELDERGL